MQLSRAQESAVLHSSSLIIDIVNKMQHFIDWRENT